MNDARQNLICILQNAYSGEMAAAYAYRGHWRSLKKSAVEREKIRQIEAKELEMPECFDEMMEMARVEQEHEDFFRSVVAKHRLLPITRRFFRWS